MPPKFPLRRLSDIASLLQRHRIMILTAPPPVLSLTIRQLPPNNSNISRLIESGWESWRIGVTPTTFELHLTPSSGVRWRFIYVDGGWRAEWHAPRHLGVGDGETEVDATEVVDALTTIYQRTLAILSDVSTISLHTAPATAPIPLPQVDA